MLTTEQKQNLRIRLEAIAEHDGYPTIEKELAAIVRELLEAMPATGDHAAGVRRLVNKAQGPQS